jgi:hypothetical protein
MCLCTVSFSPLQEFRIRFLSTGNDQRVKLWSVSIHIEKLGLSRYNSDIGSDAMSALGKFPPTNCDQAWVARDIDVLPKSTFSQNPIHFS